MESFPLIILSPNKLIHISYEYESTITILPPTVPPFQTSSVVNLSLESSRGTEEEGEGRAATPPFAILPLQCSHIPFRILVLTSFQLTNTSVIVIREIPWEIPNLVLFLMNWYVLVRFRLTQLENRGSCTRPRCGRRRRSHLRRVDVEDRGNGGGRRGGHCRT